MNPCPCGWHGAPGGALPLHAASRSRATARACPVRCSTGSTCRRRAAGRPGGPVAGGGGGASARRARAGGGGARSASARASGRAGPPATRGCARPSSTATRRSRRGAGALLLLAACRRLASRPAASTACAAWPGRSPTSTDGGTIGHGARGGGRAVPAALPGRGGGDLALTPGLSATLSSAVPSCGSWVAISGTDGVRYTDPTGASVKLVLPRRNAAPRSRPWGGRAGGGDGRIRGGGRAEHGPGGAGGGDQCDDARERPGPGPCKVEVVLLAADGTVTGQACATGERGSIPRRPSDPRDRANLLATSGRGLLADPCVRGRGRFPLSTRAWHGSHARQASQKRLPRRQTLRRRTMKARVRKVGQVAVVDLAGKITIGEGDVVLREKVIELLDGGQPPDPAQPGEGHVHGLGRHRRARRVLQAREGEGRNGQAAQPFGQGATICCS